eukprot:1548797-Amphidinium_carterae.2
MHYSNFDPKVRSLVAGVICKKCQTAVTEKARGYFTCRTCGMKLPHKAAAPETRQFQRCQNCTQQKERGVQTCIKCGARIEGSRSNDIRRNRLCASCCSEA